MAGLKPDPSVRGQLGIDEVERRHGSPAGHRAHYHNAEAESLLDAPRLTFLHSGRTLVILLPRNQRQTAELRVQWAPWIEKRKIIIPDRVLDGLNLIWFSDLVISGGGTMNREAAALGVPVTAFPRDSGFG